MYRRWIAGGRLDRLTPAALADGAFFSEDRQEMSAWLPPTRPLKLTANCRSDDRWLHGELLVERNNGSTRHVKLSLSV